MIQYDVYYAENASFTLDIRIILKTFRVLVNQLHEARGAKKR